MAQHTYTDMLTVADHEDLCATIAVKYRRAKEAGNTARMERLREEYRAELEFRRACQAHAQAIKQVEAERREARLAEAKLAARRDVWGF